MKCANGQLIGASGVGDVGKYGVLRLLTVDAVHICFLTGGFSATSVPRQGSKLSAPMVS